jgi:hypothetical protein
MRIFTISSRCPGGLKVRARHPQISKAGMIDRRGMGVGYIASVCYVYHTVRPHRTLNTEKKKPTVMNILR